MFNQTDALLTLSYLMGERTVPTTNVASRQDFIQTTLDSVYGAYSWRVASKLATVSLTNQAATLASGFDIRHQIQVYDAVTGAELEEISLEDAIHATTGSRKFWLASPNNDGIFTVNTPDTDLTTLKAIYQTSAPLINGSIPCPLDIKQTVALGARRWVKMSQNPDADVSQDEQLFQTHLSAEISNEQVPAARRKRKSAQSRGNHSTGEF